MMTPDKYQKKLIGLILDAYEKTGTYRKDTEQNQHVKIPVGKVFEGYDRDDADLAQLRAFEESMRALARQIPVEILYKDKKRKNEFSGFRIPAAKVEPLLYELVGRTPKRDIHRAQIPLYQRYLERGGVTGAFAADQIALLQDDRNAWFEEKTAEDVLKILSFVEKNRTDILYRELSIALFGNTKYIEKHALMAKVLRVLRTYGGFDFALEDFDSTKEYESAVLAEYAVFENPTYVNFNGNGDIRFRNGTALHLRSGVPVAIRSDRIADIDKVQVEDAAFLTIENLTSYNRLASGMFQVYLAGYHNHAKQAFLVKVRDENPGIRAWYHFGDLDPDGFCILENLREKTGIDFRPWGMDAGYLETYRQYTKQLNDNDRKKAAGLLAKNRYTEALTYMLEHDCKLEQEIISWKEETG